MLETFYGGEQFARIFICEAIIKILV
jgi:hypothetical protein